MQPIEIIAISTEHQHMLNARLHRQMSAALFSMPAVYRSPRVAARQNSIRGFCQIRGDLCALLLPEFRAHTLGRSERGHGIVVDRRSRRRRDCRYDETIILSLSEALFVFAWNDLNLVTDLVAGQGTGGIRFDVAGDQAAILDFEFFSSSSSRASLT